MKYKIHVSILVMMVMVLTSIVPVFGEMYECLRWRHYENGVSSAPSQMKGTILRDGQEIDSLNSPRTQSFTFSPDQEGGIPDDVSPPPELNAQTGDTLIITDITGVPGTMYDFQIYHDSIPKNPSPEHFYSRSPFPYELELEEPGEYDFFLNVRDSNGWSSWGNYRVLGRLSATRESWWYFSHFRVVVNETPDPVVTVSGSASPNPVTLEGGSGSTTVSLNAALDSLPEGASISHWEIGMNPSQGDPQNVTVSSSRQNIDHTFDEITVTGRATVALGAIAHTTEGPVQSNTSIIILTEEESEEAEEEWWINAEKRFYAWPSTVEISYQDFENNEPKAIGVELEAFRSEASHGIDGYQYRIRRRNKSFHDPGNVFTDFISSTTYTQNEFFIYPSDADSEGVVEVDGRIGVRDNLGNISYSSSRTREIQFDIITIPPEAIYQIPVILFPNDMLEELDPDIPANRIEWIYDSEDNFEYEKSIVNLYQRVRDDEGEVELVPVIEDREQTEKTLFVYGEAHDEFVLDVRVVDEIGQISAEQKRNIYISDGKPVADFDQAGTHKMYREISIDGAASREATNHVLEEWFPLDLEAEGSYFLIEAVTEDGDPEPERNHAIRAPESSMTEEGVLVAGNPDPSLRFDEHGYYQITYQVTNHVRDSEPTQKIFYVHEEIPPTIDVNIPESTVYRDPDDHLKARFEVNYAFGIHQEEYDPDKIDESETRVNINHSLNLPFSGTDPYYVTAQETHLPSELTLIDQEFESDGVKLVFEADNTAKNPFGYYRFDIYVQDEPATPYFEKYGPVGPIYKDSTGIYQGERMVLIDNRSPVMDVSVTTTGNIEVWIFDEGGRSISINEITQQLRLNRVDAIIHYVDESKVIRTYNTDGELIP